jgi:photosystem II stability/assembly factor-like uncharacterized protein
MRNSAYSRFARGLFVSALVGGGVLAYGATFSAQEQETKDDPTARRLAMYQWYNDAAPDPSPGRGRSKRPFSPGYQRFLNQAAARERARYGTQLPGLTGSAAAIGGATAPGEWANLGPTKADFLKNGSFTLAKTDTGRVRTIVIHPTNPNAMYVAFAAGGVWSTTDTGANWTPLTESLGTLSVGSIAVDPAAFSTIYLGFGDPFDGTGIGFVKSTDSGATWSTPVYLGDSTTISQILVSPSNPSTLFAATDKGLFRSNDGGGSWSLVPLATGQTAAPHAWSIESGAGSRLVVTLEATPAATSGTTNGQIWFSNDGGDTWARSTGVTVRTGVGRMTVAAAPSNRNVMYAMAAVPNAATTSDLAEIFKSVNGGATWTALGAAKKSYKNGNAESRSLGTLTRGQGWYDHLVMVDPLVPDIAYFGGALLLAKTSDGGSTFYQVTNWLAQYGLPYVHADFHAGAFDNAGNMYVGTDGGIFRSSDLGATWSDTLNIGIVTHLLYSVGSSPNNENAVIGGMQDNGTRLRSGTTATFNQVIGGDGFGSDVHPVNAQNMLGSLYYSRVYKSTNGGLSFASSCTGIAECGNSSSAPFFTRVVPFAGDATGQTVFTASNTRVYRSTNYATSWSAVGSTGLPADIGIRNFGVSAANANYIGIAATAGRIFLTSNGGATWTLAGAPPDNGLSMSAVAFDPTVPSTIYIASVAPDATKGHAWKSTNGGANWTRIDGTGFPTGVPVNALVKRGADLYAATHLGVYVSGDDGASWTRWGNNLPLVNVTDLNFSIGSRVRAATYGRGFWEILR